MEQLWERRQWDCEDVTQQSTAEDAEKPRREVQHARRDRRGSVVWRNGEHDSVGGEKLGNKAGCFP